MGFKWCATQDDFVILCRSQFEAEAGLEEIREWVAAVGLTLHPEKTHIVDSREKSFGFLGYSFRGRFRFPRERANAKWSIAFVTSLHASRVYSIECIIAASIAR